jgi:hypothetical protein
MKHRFLLLTLCLAIVAAIPCDLRADGNPAKTHQAAQTPPIELGTSGSLSTEARRGTGMGGRCGAFTLGSAVTCDGRLHILGTN